MAGEADFTGETGRAEIAPEASICKIEPRVLAALAGATLGVVGAETIAGAATVAGTVTGAAVGAASMGAEGATGATIGAVEGAETGRGAAIFAAKVGETPGGLASERGESEPVKSRALEAKVHIETLRFNRDALAGAKRCVQLDVDAFVAVRRGVGANRTMKSPLDFEGAVWFSEVTCEKTAPKLQKRLWLESRS